METVIKTVAISLISSLMCSIVVALITAFLSRRNENRRIILERRLELYTEIYGEIEKSRTNRGLFFSSQYINKLISYNAQMKLLASEKTYDAFKLFGSFAFEIYKGFKEYYNRENPHNDSDLSCDDDFFGFNYVTEVEGDAFNAAIAEYKENHKPKQGDIQKLIAEVHLKMCDDISSKK